MAFIQSDLVKTASGDEPMWGNVGDELARMFPTSAGFSDALSNIGFWGGGGALNQALKGQLEQEKGRRESRTARDVANINANQAQNQALMRLWEQVYGHLPLEYQRLAQQGDIATNKQQLELMEKLLGIKTQENVAKIHAGATMGAADINAKGRVDAATAKPPTVREAPSDWAVQRGMEIKQEWDKAHPKEPLSMSTAQLAARNEWDTRRLGDKLTLKQNPPIPGQTGTLPDIGTVNAKAAVSPETISQDLMQSDPALSLMMGTPTLSTERGPASQESTQYSPPAGPMAKFATKGQGLPSEMTRRMYAPTDQLVNGGGGQIVNDPRAAAREQSLANLTEPLTNGAQPQPQSRYSKEHPAAWEELMTTMGYAPPESFMRQGGGEDVLRAPTTREKMMGDPALANLVLGPLGPAANKYVTGRYNQRNESPILDLLPLITMGIGGAASGIKVPTTAMDRYWSQMLSKPYSAPNITASAPSMEASVPRAIPKMPIETTPKPAGGESYAKYYDSWSKPPAMDTFYQDMMATRPGGTPPTYAPSQPPKPAGGPSFQDYWGQWTQRPTPGVGTAEGPMWGSASLEANAPTTAKTTDQAARMLKQRGWWGPKTLEEIWPLISRYRDVLSGAY